MTREMLQNNFKEHTVTNLQRLKMDVVREKFKELAEWVQDNTIHSRETSLALTNLEQGMFWANASIARNDTE